MSETKTSQLAFSNNTGLASIGLPVLREQRNGKFIAFGEDNLFLQRTRDLYYNSSLDGAIINKKVDYIMGQGLLDESGEANAFLAKANRKGETLESIVRKCAIDHEIHGGFTFQVVFSKRSTNEEPEIAEIYYKPIMHFRFDIDEYHLKYAKSWDRWNSPKTIWTDPYDTDNMTGTTVYYYAGIHTQDLYPIPYYMGGIDSIATDVNIKTFYKAQTQNGMFPSLLINFFNGEVDERTKDMIEQQMINKFTGPQAAGKIVLGFNDPRNPTPPTIQPIESNNLDTRFIEMNKEIQTSIFRAHAFSPILLGEATPGKLGMTNEINDARQLFQQDYVYPAQCRILDQFTKVLQHNFPGIKLKLDPLKALKSAIKEDKSMLPLMTLTEARTVLKDYGLIDEVQPTEELIPVERLVGLRNPISLAPGYTAVSESQDEPNEEATPIKN